MLGSIVLARLADRQRPRRSPTVFDRFVVVRKRNSERVESRFDVHCARSAGPRDEEREHARLALVIAALRREFERSLEHRARNGRRVALLRPSEEALDGCGGGAIARGRSQGNRMPSQSLNVALVLVRGRLRVPQRDVQQLHLLRGPADLRVPTVHHERRGRGAALRRVRHRVRRHVARDNNEHGHGSDECNDAHDPDP